MPIGFAFPIKRLVYFGKTVGFKGEMAEFQGFLALKNGRFGAKFRAGAAKSGEFASSSAKIKRF